MGLEVFTFDKRSFFVLSRNVCCTVVFRYGIVNSILGKLSMEFAWLSVEAKSAEVIYSIGQVRGLLDFSDEAALADAVDASCRKKEHIA